MTEQATRGVTDGKAMMCVALVNARYKEERVGVENMGGREMIARCRVVSAVQREVGGWR